MYPSTRQVVALPSHCNAMIIFTNLAHSSHNKKVAEWILHEDDYQCLEGGIYWLKKIHRSERIIMFYSKAIFKCSQWGRADVMKITKSVLSK